MMEEYKCLITPSVPLKIVEILIESKGTWKNK
jgi:hypothetical protein